MLACDTDEASFSHPNILPVRMDLREEASIQAAFALARQRFGPLHLLINNGAVSHFCKPLPDLAAGEWDNVLDTNLRGAFLCCRAFQTANAGAGYGRIINIASTRGLQNEAHWEAYGASKGGLTALTVSLCVSLRGSGITVNAISPGWIETGDHAAPAPGRPMPSIPPGVWDGRTTSCAPPSSWPPRTMISSTASTSSWTAA